MRIVCEKCRTAYQVPEERVPFGGAQVNCPVCGGSILIPGVPSRVSSSGASSSRGHPPGSAGAPPGTAGEGERDFGKTISFDFSQIMQKEEDILRLEEEARSRPPFLQPGTRYSLRDAAGREYPLVKPEIIIGRSGADINLPDSEVSRRHCLLKVMGDTLILLDQESTNGTWVEGDKVKTARLSSGQTFTLGNTSLEFHLEKG